MANKPDLISLQGEVFLAKLTNGVAGTYHSIGNTPKLELKIKSTAKEHYESKTGLRTKDAVLYQQTGVSIDGTLEEVTKENLARVMSGLVVEVPSSTITDVSLGTVTLGAMINLGHRNLSAVTFKDGATTVDPSKYTLDLTFGTVIFNESISGAVTWAGTAGAVVRTTVANNVGEEYALMFKGIDTFTQDKVFCELWRVQFSPDTTFALINNDFGSFDVSGDALSDSSKANDAELSVFGHIERFAVTA
ncbi:phage tail tube protein [Acinetobacter sp. ANC 5502]